MPLITNARFQNAYSNETFLGRVMLFLADPLGSLKITFVDKGVNIILAKFDLALQQVLRLTLNFIQSQFTYPMYKLLGEDRWLNSWRGYIHDLMMSWYKMKISILKKYSHSSKTEIMTLYLQQWFRFAGELYISPKGTIIFVHGGGHLFVVARVFWGGQRGASFIQWVKGGKQNFLHMQRG